MGEGLQEPCQGEEGAEEYVLSCQLLRRLLNGRALATEQKQRVYRSEKHGRKRAEYM